MSGGRIQLLAAIVGATLALSVATAPAFATGALVVRNDTPGPGPGILCIILSTLPEVESAQAQAQFSDPGVIGVFFYPGAKPSVDVLPPSPRLRP